MTAANDMARLWGTNILNARAGSGLSQEALAELVGVTQPAVCRWETGKASPRDGLKGRVAAALGVPAAQMFPLDEAAT